MSFQVGRELLKNYLNNYVAFVALLKKSNMTSMDEMMNAFNKSVPSNFMTSGLPDLTYDQEPITADSYINSMPAVRAFFYCLYCLIFLVGICGNALVCYVVLRNKNMQTVTNLFITNLALSDILLCTFAVPVTPLYLLTFRNWVFGKLFCHLLPYAQGVSVYISAFTLMSIAIDRFFVIIYPFKPRMEIRICLTIIACVWISAAVLTFPYGWYMEIVQIPENGKLYCEEVWPKEASRKAFGFSTSVLQFVIPFIIISFCYMKVCLKLRDRARQKPGAKSVRKEELERERTRRTNRMLISMVVIFGLSWLPLNMNNLIADFYSPANEWLFARAFFLLCHAAAMSSTCYNPFLYAWLNENFRKEFKQVLPCFRQNSTSSSTSEHHHHHRKRQTLNENQQPADRTCNGHETIQMQEQSVPAVNEVAIAMGPADQRTNTGELKRSTSGQNKNGAPQAKTPAVCHLEPKDTEVKANIVKHVRDEAV
ncbi:Neuropeptide Y receptor type 2 [Halotydeus destructor]|nr:Neuropeptide Y receptor type 2 [Halotydeus destructor]